MDVKPSHNILACNHGNVKFCFKIMIFNNYFLTVFLILVRILAVFMTAPILSSRNVPVMAKIGFSGLLAFILLPLSAKNTNLAAVSTDLWPFALLVAQEVLVGTLIGFISNLIFLAIGMGASVMGLQIGFSAASVFNPLINASSEALDQLYIFLAAGLFLAVNAHHWLILSLVRSFEVIPLGTFVFSDATAEHLIFLTSQTFVIAVRLSMPVIAVLLLAEVGLGIIAKAVPQIQIFFLSLPLKIGLCITALALTLVITLPIVEELFSGMMAQILALGAS
jgi:flagellar biosynthetic protein FliR